MKAAIYVHIPFCARKCAYCDFESHVGLLDRAGEYMARVVEEARAAREEYGAFGVPSVYIGGGTPSLLPAEMVGGLLEKLNSLFPLEGDAEISMEANPGTIDAQKLRAVAAAGVNRLSFGAQASQARLLALLNRVHRWADVERAAEWARGAGLDNYNFDLMYALPEQRAADFAESVERALALEPAHLSCYSLILEEGTPLTRRVEAGELALPDDEETVNMQHMAQEILRKNGFERYEISNYARPGRECRHNIAYWTRENYLGLGCAAHSLMNETRFGNPGFHEYMKGHRREEQQSILPQEAREEAIMLETRLTRGLRLNGFPETERARLIAEGEKMAAAGLLKIENGFLALTMAGMDVQTAVVLRLVEALERAK